MAIMPPFNKVIESKINKILVEENKFISNLLDILPIPASASSAQDEFMDTVEDTVNIPRIENGKTRAQSLEELQSRLLDIKSKRNLNYKDKMLKKGLKNRIKKKRNKDNLRLKKNYPKTLTEETTDPTADIKVKKSKPIFNNQGKMVFSKFDFREVDGKTKTVKPKSEKDPRKLLKQLEKQKDKLKQLEKDGEVEKVAEIKEKTAWKSALAKADGQKLKDDPELLKKSAMHKDQQLKKSTKKWQARQEAVEKAGQERQKKRSDNINKRKKDKKVKNMKKAVKRGKVIAGF